jgi:hypothetical protein
MDDTCQVCEWPYYPRCICPEMRAARVDLVQRIKDRMTDSDLDSLVADDAKDDLWAAFDVLAAQE